MNIEKITEEIDSLRRAVFSEIEELYAEINDLKDKLKEVKSQITQYIGVIQNG